MEKPPELTMKEKIFGLAILAGVLLVLAVLFPLAAKLEIGAILPVLLIIAWRTRISKWSWVINIRQPVITWMDRSMQNSVWPGLTMYAMTVFLSLPALHFAHWCQGVVSQAQTPLGVWLMTTAWYTPLLCMLVTIPIVTIMVGTFQKQPTIHDPYM